MGEGKQAKVRHNELVSFSSVTFSSKVEDGRGVS